MSPGKKGEVRFLLDRDRQPWTWVMGEHKDDKPIEVILEEEAQNKAQKLAEEEALRKQYVQLVYNTVNIQQRGGIRASSVLDCRSTSRMIDPAPGV